MKDICCNLLSPIWPVTDKKCTQYTTVEVLVRELEGSTYYTNKCDTRWFSGLQLGYVWSNCWPNTYMTRSRDDNNEFNNRSTRLYLPYFFATAAASWTITNSINVIIKTLQLNLHIFF